MASFTRDSKFRHCVVEVGKRESFYENLKTLIPQNDINGVAGNSSMLCYIDPSGSGSALGILPIASVGKNHIPVTSPAYQQPIIRAHSQPIQDFEFNPFNTQQVLTCAADQVLKLWEVPKEGLIVDMNEPKVTMAATQKYAMKGIAVNTCAEGVVAVRGAKVMTVFDLAAGAEVCSSPDGMYPVSGDIQSMVWSHKGDMLVTTSKDKMLCMVDVRGSWAATTASAHVGLRFSRSVWLGDSPYLLSVGHNNMQEREYMLWDSRDMSKPFKRERIDNSTGPLIPLFDPDLNLLSIAGKGDASLRLYELDTASPEVLCALSNTNVGEPIRGLGLLPKQVCDRMNTEVLRFLKLGEGVIQPVSVSVPRKEKFKYQADLYPPTYSEALPAQSAAEWLAGGHAEPNRLPMLEPGATFPGSAVLAVETPQAEKASAVADAESGSVSPAPSSRSISPMPSSSRGSLRASMTTMLKYRHMFGTENKKEETLINLQPDLSSNDSPIIACSEQFLALPYRGGGGPVYVAPLDNFFGKAKGDACLIKGHKMAVSDIGFSPFRPELMATASMDCTVKVWDVCSTDNYENITPLHSFANHSNSVRTVQFHPTVPHLLTSTAQDGTLRLSDVDSGSEVSSYDVFGTSEGGACANISFSYDGLLIAAAGKDRVVRIIDPRTSSTVLVSESARTAATAGSLSPKSPFSTLGRNLRVAWCANQSLFDPIVTVCSSSAGMRTLHVWDPRSMSAPLTSKMIDNGSGQLFPMWDEGLGSLFLAGKGDTIIRTYEIASLVASAAVPGDAPLTRDVQLDGPIFFEKSVEFQSNSREPVAGICMMPKRLCDVRNIETARMLKLTSDSIIPLSFKAPRADHLKQYFHDDIFLPVRSQHSEVTVEDWTNPETPAVIFAPVLESLKPADILSIADKPDDVVAPSESKSKVASFRHSMKVQEEESKQREEGFNRLQALAQQNAKYNVNLSGGGGSGAVRAKGEVAQLAAENSDSDDNWDD